MTSILAQISVWIVIALFQGIIGNVIFGVPVKEILIPNMIGLVIVWFVLDGIAWIKHKWYWHVANKEKASDE